jgi:hypothetical protein
MSKQKQYELPVEYAEDEFVLPKQISDKYVDYDMSKQEGK